MYDLPTYFYCAGIEYKKTKYADVLDNRLVRRHTGVQVYSGIYLERRYTVINRRDHDYNVNCVYDYEDICKLPISYRPPIYFRIILCI